MCSAAVTLARWCLMTTHMQLLKSHGCSVHSAQRCVTMAGAEGRTAMVDSGYMVATWHTSPTAPLMAYTASGCRNLQRQQLRIRCCYCYCCCCTMVCTQCVGQPAPAHCAQARHLRPL